MRNFIKAVFISLLIIIPSIFSFISTAHAVPYNSYTYDFWEEPVPAPQAYKPAHTVDGIKLGVGEFSDPRDFFVCREEKLYILDSGNNRIVISNLDNEVIKVIDSFDNNGEVDSFNRPSGIFVTDDENIYVADTRNSRVIELDRYGNLNREIGPPESDITGIIPEDFTYRPSKIAVDSVGRIYIVGEEVYDGLIQFDVDGNFQGFIGAPRVSPSVADIFWRTIATEEQRRRTALFLPMEHRNVSLDERGFLFVTVRGEEVSPDERIRRLNPTGWDVLRRLGFHPPVGDYGEWTELTDEMGELLYPPSSIVDIAPRDNEMYSMLDRVRGRIFTYDNNGNLLYVFGNRSDQVGAFRSPVAIHDHNNDIFVLDQRTGTVTIFEPTLYAETIHQAIDYYFQGEYEASTDKWEEVLNLNVNFDVAYTGIGNVMMLQNRFEKAMHYYRLGENREGFSKAYRLYRRDIISENFNVIFLAIVGLILLVLLGKRFVPFHKLEKYTRPTLVDGVAKEDNTVLRIIQELFYSLKIIFHPFSGYWELKHEKRASFISATILLFMTVFSYVIMVQYTGFIFNTRKISEINLLSEAATVVIPFLLWCSVNWSLTTLMEGKGTLKEIYITTAYSMVPLILLLNPGTLLSNIFVIEEGNMYYLIIVLALLWSLVLLFFGTMTVHDYDVPKMAFTSLLTLAGIGVVLFIFLVFFDLFFRTSSFFQDIYYEISFRM